MSSSLLLIVASVIRLAEIINIPSIIYGLVMIHGMVLLSRDRKEPYEHHHRRPHPPPGTRRRPAPQARPDAATGCPKHHPRRPARAPGRAGVHGRARSRRTPAPRQG